MNLFTISDLHLSFGTDKPMDVFRGWENHAERLQNNWNRIVSVDDTVVVIGDVSWAIDFNQLLPDFTFLNSLNGKKIIIKGNHDYWWSTVTKIKQFISDNHFDTISILHNNAYKVGDFAICGTRGWLYDGTGTDDIKVTNRECGRLETSIKSALALGGEPMVFLHYPPAYGEFQNSDIIGVLKKYEIKKIYYGHIHGSGFNKSLSEYDGIKMKLVSCDCIDFSPITVKK